MRLKALSLLLGALVATTVGFQAPAMALNSANNAGASIPNNKPNQSVPSNVNTAMVHIKAAYSAAARAHADVVDGRYKDASADIKTARNSMDAAAKIKHLPLGLTRTIHRINSELPRVERSINNQMADARIQTGNFVTAMNHDINGLTLATTTPLGGGAGPIHKTTPKKAVPQGKPAARAIAPAKVPAKAPAKVPAKVPAKEENGR